MQSCLATDFGDDKYRRRSKSAVVARCSQRSSRDPIHSDQYTRLPELCDPGTREELCPPHLWVPVLSLRALICSSHDCTDIFSPCSIALSYI
ncbi:hypothetical protein RRG08_037626 [Elysia crispata]|uniref:Uncharacterized protein n=1 Tax=Elysia crispata TaxID=231223 RepID=A0AAE1CYB3_9GAST|nr:hypothetical protein RRG08_037626 [Elysia crispata]